MGHPEERDHGFPERIPWSPPPPPPHSPTEPLPNHRPPSPAQESVVDRVLRGGIGRPLAVGVIAVLAIVAGLSDRETESSTIVVSSEQAAPLFGETTTTNVPATIRTTPTTAATASSTTTSLSNTTTSLSTIPTTASTTSLAPTTAESSTTGSTTATEAPTTSPPTTIETTTTSAAGSGCDPNYSGCVPVASDVDCAGGSGNGPAYVAGPVRVIGQDIYGLDADNDGIGCEDG